MSTMRTTFVLRQRSDVELRELAIRLLQEHGSEVAAFTLLFAAPWLVLLAVLPQMPEFLLVALCWLLAPMLELPTLLLLSRRVFGLQQSPRETTAMIAKALRSALWLRFWSAPMVALYNIVPGIGGFLFGTRYPFLPEVTALEHASGAIARTRSRALSAFVNLPPAASALVTYTVVALVSDLGLRAGLRYLMSVHLGPTFFKGGSPHLFLLGLLLAAPMVSAHRYLSYVQARMTAEGWDLRLDFETLASAITEQERR